MSSSQEEADTKLILHARFAAVETNGPLVIVADDTDVLILALAHQSDIPQRMFLLKRTSARKRLVDVQHLSKALGLTVCKALPGLHAYTGCDYTSAFAGQDKLKALKLVKQKPYHQ